MVAKNQERELQAQYEQLEAHFAKHPEHITLEMTPQLAAVVTGYVGLSLTHPAAKETPSYPLCLQLYQAIIKQLAHGEPEIARLLTHERLRS